MLVFLHARVLSRVAGFPVASPCLWGKLENLSFSKVSKEVVMLFCVAGVARCFSCGVAVSMGEAGKHVLFECFQAGCHVVLRGRRGTL